MKNNRYHTCRHTSKTSRKIV